MSSFSNGFSEEIWRQKYQSGEEASINETQDRIAKALADVEPKHKKKWEKEFRRVLDDFKFIPGGRIMSNAGIGLEGTTLINCFVDGFVGVDQDSIEGIYEALLRQAKTLQSEGGYGFCCSVMRPRGSRIGGIGNQSPGAIKFLELWDKSSEIITAGSGKAPKKGEKNFIRKGAQMVTCPDWHPDVVEFIVAKKEPGRLTKFNMSVLVSDALMKAVEQGEEWVFMFPNFELYPEDYKNHWDGNLENWNKHMLDKYDKGGAGNGGRGDIHDISAVKCYGSMPAKDLWEMIMDNTYNRNEPGVLFVDTMNRMNNLYYIEQIMATNPCGEQILPKHAVCLLGSLNLVHYIIPETQDWDYDALARDIPVVVRFLDNVNDIANVPLPEQQESLVNKRRIGLGVIGFSSALMMAKVRYGSPKSIKMVDDLMQFMVDNCYLSSAMLAKEKGSFPLYDEEKYLESEFIKSVVSPEVVDVIRACGMRNSHLCSIQPTGNTSIFANLIGSGLEPIFSEGYFRSFIQQCAPEGMVVPVNINWGDKTFEIPELMPDGYEEVEWKWIKEGDENLLVGKFKDDVYKIDQNRGLCKEEFVEDYAITWLKENDRMWKGNKPKWASFAFDLTTKDHVDVMSTFAKYVDSAISKTVNLPNDYPYEDFKDVYYNAWKSGIKGFTTYRHGTMANVLLTESSLDAETQIVPNHAPKRPKELPCDVYHISVNKQPYFVLVGLLDGKPYEVFAGKNGFVEQKVKRGIIIKNRRSQYKVILDNEMELSPIKAFTTEEGDTITRLISSNLRHGVDISFLVHQLEKSKGDFSSFNKSIIRALKKYIKDGTEVKGEDCPECDGSLIRQEGCILCPKCGFSKCS